MEALVVGIFIVGYFLITIEHTLKLDKTVPAVIMAALCWAVIAIFGLELYDIQDGLVPVKDGLMKDSHLMNGLTSAGLSPEEINHELTIESVLHSLSHHIAKISEILIFLIGAMTIVEIIDLHKGFSIIKKYIKTRSKKKLLWIVAILAFVLSAIIDNLTSTIVLITILRKLITKKDQRMWYVGIIIIAANAGGAWSPIGDVTTTMLWIGKKVTPLKLIEFVLFPSILCMLIPVLIAQRNKAFQGNFELEDDANQITYKNSDLMFFVGIGMIIFVPIFKSITHLPPYVGMLLSMGVVWLVAEIANKGNFKKGMSVINNELSPEEKHQKRKDFIQELKGMSAHHALSKIEMSINII